MEKYALPPVLSSIVNVTLVVPVPPALTLGVIHVSWADIDQSASDVTATVTGR